ncbi:hypothetical protein [uncultured Draconibacterium sp.]|uniref:hypothetical protein n=1 Tax=uncultured Draconibacterium sp. TaxID=1573823 RepID=UPI00326006B1
MKKSIFTIAIILSVMSLVFTSCSDNDDEVPTLDGKYSLVLDGKTVASGETEEVGMVGNAISLSKGEDFGFIISGVPEAVGAEAAIGANGSGVSVSITGKNLLGNGADELYFSVSGTVKRTSASKVTFEGTCSELGSTTVHTFSGSAESDAYKVI